MENSMLGLAKRGRFASDFHEKQLFEPRSPEYAGPLNSDQSEAAIRTSKRTQMSGPKAPKSIKKLSRSFAKVTKFMQDEHILHRSQNLTRKMLSDPRNPNLPLTRIGKSFETSFKNRCWAHGAKKCTQRGQTHPLSRPKAPQTVPKCSLRNAKISVRDAKIGFG